MAQGFGVAFLRVELARHGEGLPWRFVEGDAVAGYVGEEGTAARELVVHVHQRMHDEIDGCGEVPGDGQLAHQMIVGDRPPCRSEEHTSELQSLMRISYAVFCLKKKKQQNIP